LINGPTWASTPGRSLTDEIRAAVLELRRPHRAVTCADFESLALAADPAVARARRRRRRAGSSGCRGRTAGRAPAPRAGRRGARTRRGPRSRPPPHARSSARLDRGDGGERVAVNADVVHAQHESAVAGRLEVGGDGGDGAVDLE